MSTSNFGFLLPGPDPEGADGDVFDAFEIEWVGEYERYVGDERICEPIIGDPDEDMDMETRVGLMVTLYGHFSTGGAHAIADAIVSHETHTKEQAVDYIRRLAGSIAAGRPITDHT